MARLLGLTRLSRQSLPWMSTAAPARMVHADIAVSGSTFGRMLVGSSSRGGSRGSAAAATPRNPPIIPKRVVVITKTTRYEDESMRISRKPFGQLSESEFLVVNSVLTRLGYNVPAMMDSHDEQKSSLQSIIDILKSRQIDVQVVTSGERFTSMYTDEAERQGGPGDERKTTFLEGDSGTSMSLAMLESGQGTNTFDFCISAGGDGTFLRASLGITGRIPLVGLNTDPTRSRGRLCTAEAKDLGKLLDRLAVGNYEWQQRSRIQLTLRTIGSDTGKRGRVLRQHALNEVFVGEKDPCRASVLKVQKDDKEPERYKCSGLIVSTGTGASAWTSEASTFTPQDVMHVLGGMTEVYGEKADVSKDISRILKSVDGFDAGAVAAATNRMIEAARLPPDDRRLQFLVREPILSSNDISAGNCVFAGPSAKEAHLMGVSGAREQEHHPDKKFIVNKLTISSVGMDAHLVLDGRVWVALERGVEAVLETSKEHVLWSFKSEGGNEEWGKDG